MLSNNNNIFNIIKRTTRLLIKSALVKTCIDGIEFSTKYLLPTAPNIPPRLSVIRVSKHLQSIKYKLHEYNEMKSVINKKLDDINRKQV